MSRNAESRFDVLPSIGIQRSKLDGLSHSNKTTFNVGDLVPLTRPIEVLPGDTFDITTSKVIRMQTLVAPIMDTIVFDQYWFFVPSRLVWEHWKEFMGENTASAWIPSTTYSIPQITAPSGGWTEGTIADYFGIPTKVGNISVNALPFRCYSICCDEWFRDQNLTDPLYWSQGDATVAGSNGSSYRTDVPLGGKPYVAAKLHDAFTSSLPGPQKGPDVQLPLTGNAPVITSNTTHANSYGINFFNSDYGNTPFSTGYTYVPTIKATSTSDAVTQGYQNSGTNLDPNATLIPNNLWADLSAVSAATINSLRIAFQIQKLLEKDAMYGSRYIEQIKAHFNVQSPDARLQRPEYIGGVRVPININQVLSTAETTNTELGATGAYSLTVDVHSDFVRSFTEHGYLICLGVARYPHSYQNGLDKLWTRKDRLDFYYPVLAHIGNLPVLNENIYAQGTTADKQVFGYQEAWYEYRWFGNMVTSEMRSNASTSLDAWHLADEYSSMPYLSDAWIREDKSNVDRALLVQSNVSNQIFADFYFDIKATRPMPVYSIPGLIDHN